MKRSTLQRKMHQAPSRQANQIRIATTQRLDMEIESKAQELGKISSSVEQSVVQKRIEVKSLEKLRSETERITKKIAAEEDRLSKKKEYHIEKMAEYKREEAAVRAVLRLLDREIGKAGPLVEKVTNLQNEVSRLVQEESVKRSDLMGVSKQLTGMHRALKNVRAKRDAIQADNGIREQEISSAQKEIRQKETALRGYSKQLKKYAGRLAQYYESKGLKIPDALIKLSGII